MEKERIENEEDIDIYEMIDIFLKRRKIFFSIVLVAFIGSLVMGYFYYKNRDNTLSIEFHIAQDRMLSDELFQKSGLSLPKLEIEKVSGYIKNSNKKQSITVTKNRLVKNEKISDLGNHTIEITNLEKIENVIYLLKSEDGENLFNEKDKIFFEANKYIAEEIENIIVSEEKTILENLDFLSLEVLNTSDNFKKERLLKGIDDDLEHLKILNGLKLQKKYSNMIEIDNIALEEKNDFITKFLMVNCLGIILGIGGIALYEFFEKYKLRKVSQL